LWFGYNNEVDGRGLNLIFDVKI